ncbi:MAG: hypothetical protein E7301_04710 [Butyrivibrio sp.]|uniref:hypothetical protein n=1 Tax=Butyrivibrio sp. NC2002 TaxID=1410610 RepID=UPI00056A072B|nr:hypothetical protein [Butyrivibrio sp. NC2002]MBE5859408.1 hypothetical protein [Butyrivibrio sp.]
MGITETQIAEYVGNFTRIKGYPPTVEELVSAFGFIAVTRSLFYIINLYRIGMIRNSMYFGTSDLQLLPLKAKN